MRLLLCLSVLLLVACTDPNRKATATNDRQFAMSDPNELYFRNIRSTNYMEVMPRSPHKDVFRHQSVKEVTTRPQLFGHLVLNWLEDEAYYFVETNGYDQAYTQPLTLENSAGDRIQLSDYTPAGQLAFARQLAQQLQKGDQFVVLNGAGEPVPILRTKKEREGFIIGLADFDALVK